MRKVRTGSVVRTPRGQTAVVEMVWKQRNRLYRKQVRRVVRFHVHDPLDRCRLGDIVRIQETRPISKTKRWRLLEILERRQVAEVRPIDLESDAEVIADEQAAGEEVAETETSEPAEDEPEDQEPVADNQDTEDSEE
jgi:small subunit ribosomal protein S17|tara:strand:- start:257 stop:667 length:411 start_codon:yes stop_codon:yes gene_type:complete